MNLSGAHNKLLLQTSRSLLSRNGSHQGSSRCTSPKCGAAAIQALSSLTVVILLKLVWVPGQNGIVGNCRADELAKNGNHTQIPSGWERAGFPLSSCIHVLDLWPSRYLSKSWSAISTCGVPKVFWSRVKRYGKLQAFFDMRRSF